MSVAGESWSSEKMNSQITRYRSDEFVQVEGKA